MGSDLMNEATFSLLVIQSHRILYEKRKLLVVCVLAWTEKMYRFTFNWTHVQNIWLECM